MHRQILHAALVVFALFSFAASAQQTVPTENGEGVELITPPQPTEDPEKIEVIEFFWYGCPHCYHFEPYVKKWEKNLPEDVQFIRQPAAFNKIWKAHARAYYTAEALGVLDKVHDDFYDAIQNKRQKLVDEDDLAKFFADHGVSDKEFRTAYNSFYVTTKTSQAETIPPKYGITGTPTVVVNGKYRVKAPLEKVFGIVDDLIKQERSAQTK